MKGAAFLLFLVAVIFSGAPAVAAVIAVLGVAGWLLWK